MRHQVRPVIFDATKRTALDADVRIPHIGRISSTMLILAYIHLPLKHSTPLTLQQHALVAAGNQHLAVTKHGEIWIARERPAPDEHRVLGIGEVV